MDRIRPFVALIRTLRARKQTRSDSAAEGSTNAGETPPVADDTPPPTSASFQATLQVRLQALSHWDSERARRVFVEEVLITELGANFSRDPQFTELIDEVTKLIANHPKSSGRLNQLLRTLAAK